LTKIKTKTVAGDDTAPLYRDARWLLWWCDMRRCDDVMMWWCDDVMMWWCDDVMMWWCDDVIQLLAMIRHPYIVTYDDCWIQDATLFVVMVTCAMWWCDMRLCMWWCDIRPCDDVISDATLFVVMVTFLFLFLFHLLFISSVLMVCVFKPGAGRWLFIYMCVYIGIYMYV